MIVCDFMTDDTIPVLIIRVDGTSGAIRVSRAEPWREIERVIGAAMLDGIALKGGRTMFVDDAGYETETLSGPGYIKLHPTKARKAVNIEATKFYHSVCRPGTTHQIVGDVAIVNDADFGDEDD